MKTTSSFNVQIWCGLRSGYEGPNMDVKIAEDICSNFVNEVKCCVTITPTRFLYVDGREDGFVVGLINYPRFPSNNYDITERAVELGKRLMKRLQQYRITITTPTVSIMLEEEDLK